MSLRNKWNMSSGIVDRGLLTKLPVLGDRRAFTIELTPLAQL
jgi:DNA-binding MarR family transcriptional regulator